MMWIQQRTTIVLAAACLLAAGCISTARVETADGRALGAPPARSKGGPVGPAGGTGPAAGTLPGPDPSAPAPPWRAAPAPLADALAAVGLSPAQLRIDPDDTTYFGGGLYRQAAWDVFMRDPMKLEPDVKAFRRTLLDGAGSASSLVQFGALRLREGVRRGLIESPLTRARRAAAGPKPLASAILVLDALGGRMLSPDERAELERSAAKVPEAVARPAALLLQAMTGVLEWRERGLHELKPAERSALFRTLVRAVANGNGSDGDELPRTARGLAERLDFGALYAGAADLALALDGALGGMPAAPPTGGDSRHSATPLPALPGLRALVGPREPLNSRFRARTPYGDVVISGDGNNRHAGGALLVIDTGGEDRYEGCGGTQDAVGGIAVAIDLGGNDTWSWNRAGGAGPSAGSGLLGYGYAADLAGNDSYDGGDLAQGSGFFGVGLLLDEAGDDHYASSVLSQGSALFGVGILSDLRGDDRYDVEHEGQGYGFTRGMGILVDREGNDRYVANDTLIRFPSPQTPEHNASLAQGTGSGHRADFSDGLSFAGGIGLLVDGAGDDTYAAGLFAQGAAYWYGIGVLDDAGGSDHYDGVWYVQGSAAHFGVGLLLDEGGRDVYRATMNMAQGAGHDLSWGELIDEAGDDRYEAPNLSLGGGNDNGIGILWDRGGNDEYIVAADTTLGRANITAPRGGLRDRMLCLGLFLDTGGGFDTYPKTFAGDGKLWTQHGLNVSEPLEAEKGAGLDR